MTRKIPKVGDTLRTLANLNGASTILPATVTGVKNSYSAVWPDHPWVISWEWWSEDGTRTAAGSSRITGAGVDIHDYITEYTHKEVNA